MNTLVLFKTFTQSTATQLVWQWTVEHQFEILVVLMLWRTISIVKDIQTLCVAVLHSNHTQITDESQSDVSETNQETHSTSQDARSNASDSSQESQSEVSVTSQPEVSLYENIQRNIVFWHRKQQSWYVSLRCVDAYGKRVRLYRSMKDQAMCRLLGIQLLFCQSQCLLQRLSEEDLKSLIRMWNVNDIPADIHWILTEIYRVFDDPEETTTDSFEQKQKVI